MESSVVVTGCGGSVGQFISESLHNLGYQVLGLDRTDVGQGKTTGYMVQKVDLLNRQEIESAFLELSNSKIKPSILINCAGMIHNELLVNLFADEKKHSIENWETVIASNLTTTFIVSSCFAEFLINNRSPGKIINFSSISANGTLGQSAYSAAKAGIEALTKIWSEELSPFRISCSCIAPGYLDTESTHNNMDQKSILNIIDRTSERRLGTLSELFEAVKFLMKNDFHNGKILSLDGGLFV